MCIHEIYVKVMNIKIDKVIKDTINSNEFLETLNIDGTSKPKQAIHMDDDTQATTKENSL